MPTSRSLRQNTKLLLLISVLAVLCVAVVAVPASLVKYLLPSFIGADDFSGSLWHGSAGKITVNGRDAGALEWHLHPASLLSLTLSADLHWVQVGFVLDASADIERGGIKAHAIRGGGPIEDLAGLGVATGWRGVSAFKFDELRIDFTQGPAGTGAALRSAMGDLSVGDLAAPRIAEGVDLGNYALHATGSAAELTDTGGPLELNATIQYSAKDRAGLLSGTLKERPDAPRALHTQLETLSQLHAPDAQGRLPIDLEFTL